MITLHGFGANFGLPDASPFVLKVDAFLRLAGVTFELDSGIDNVRKAPKGKLPFITDAEQIICDSASIIQHIQDKHGIDLDAHLSEEQKAKAYLLRSTLEEKTYWYGLYYRWIDDQGWEKTKSAFFDEMPAMMRLFVPALVRRDMRKALHGQGIGRHGSGEILHFARESISSVSEVLGDGPFLFGSKPCSTDACLYGHLAQITLADFDSPINTLAAEYTRLTDYCENFKQIYYAD